MDQPQSMLPRPSISPSEVKERTALRASLLQELSRELRKLDPVPSFDGPGYMRGHVAFEGASDQQGQILAWLIDYLKSQPGPRLEAASVGAGSGILDVPMLESVCAHKQVHYTVFEPFEAQCERFQERAAALCASSALELLIECKSLEQVEPGRAFDVVLAIHSIYSFQGLEEAVERLLRITRPGGELVIAVAPLEQMNQLSELFWQSHHDGALGFEEQVGRALSNLGVAHTNQRIDACLEVAMDDPGRSDIVDFLTQCPLGQCPEQIQQLVLRYLEATGDSDPSQLRVPHPVHMLRVRK